MVVGAADAARTRGPQGDRRAAVPEQQVVGRRQRVEHQLAARRVRPGRVAQHRDDVRLVHRDPVLDPVREALADQPGVLGEAVHRVAVQPAALVLERLGQVPVVERGHRLDVALQQPVDEPLVEVEPGGVRRPHPSGCTRGHEIEKR